MKMAQTKPLRRAKKRKAPPDPDQLTLELHAEPGPRWLKGLALERTTTLTKERGHGLRPEAAPTNRLSYTERSYENGRERSHERHLHAEGALAVEAAKQFAPTNAREKVGLMGSLWRAVVWVWKVLKHVPFFLAPAGVSGTPGT